MDIIICVGGDTQRHHKQPREYFRDSGCHARMEWLLTKRALEDERCACPDVHYADLDLLIDLKASVNFHTAFFVLFK